ncbi:MAG: HPP family protein [Planctomycetota bacterium]
MQQGADPTGKHAPRSIDPDRVLARDVMQRDVLVLRTDDTIGHAAARLDEIRASGAPVVDADGRLVGVLTRTDIAGRDPASGSCVSAHPAVRETDRADDAGATFDVDDGDRQRVADWMTPGAIQVAPDDTVASLCRRMLDEGIHRVFVVEQRRLVGVVSTTDVMRLLADP